MAKVLISLRCPACDSDRFMTELGVCADCGTRYVRQWSGGRAAIMIVAGVSLLLVGACGVLTSINYSLMLLTIFGPIAFIGVVILREASRRVGAAPEPRGFPVLPKMSADQAGMPTGAAEDSSPVEPLNLNLPEHK